MLQIPGNVMNKQVQLIKMVHELNLFLNCVIFDGRIHHSFRKEENVKIDLLTTTKDKSKHIIHVLNLKSIPHEIVIEI